VAPRHLPAPETEKRPRFTEPPAVLLELGRSLRTLQVAMLQMPAEDAAGETALRSAHDHVRRAIDALSNSGLLPQPDATREPGRRPRYGFGPVVGPQNPVFPEPHCEHVEGVTRGTISFPLSFEGPPGCVHGGFVALFFDQVLGQHNMAVDASGMTARLEIDYRRPTPLGRTLSFEAEGGRVDARKTITRGRLRDGDEVLALAEGTFLVPRGGMPTRTP